jgi:hypothetical protein
LVTGIEWESNFKSIHGANVPYNCALEKNLMDLLKVFMSVVKVKVPGLKMRIFCRHLQKPGGINPTFL